MGEIVLAFWCLHVSLQQDGSALAASGCDGSGQRVECVVDVI